MSLIRYLAVPLALVVFVPSAFAQSIMPSDSEFVIKASAGNLLEIEQGKLAQQKAGNAKLKAFGQQMVGDHGKALEGLLAAAKAGNVKAAAPKLDKQHQAMLDNLKDKSGAAFDAIYQADQVAAHAQTVALLLDYQKNGKNAQLQAWVEQALPVVKHHREMIEGM